MSLAARITLLTLSLLLLGNLATGYALYRQTKYSLNEELQKRLEARLNWVEAALQANPKQGLLKLAVQNEPAETADYWEVATPEGRVLWSSAPPPPGMQVVSRTIGKIYGHANDPATHSNEILEGATGLGWVPPAALKAVRAEVPEIHLSEVHPWMSRLDPTASPQVLAKRYYTIVGEIHGKSLFFTVSGTGTIFSLRVGGPYYCRYLVPKNKHLALMITVRTSATSLNQDLNRSIRIMWLIGPLGWLATAVLLTMGIRAQLAPLARMAEQTAQIGPGNPTVRLGPVGSSREAVRLRNAVNAMLERLTEGWEQERRFAATAAHELRTPLAQMKTDIEVALRRERDASDYREVLTETLADVERLQNLIEGLLYLARRPEPDSSQGRPVPLADILARAVAEYGPACLPEPAVYEGLLIRGDYDLFIAAVGNVLENAARYAPGEPPTLHVISEQGVVHLTITDSGPGIPAQDRERIFEPLTRLDERNAPESGLGLGLTVARATLRAFGGHLTCQPREDGHSGAVFVFIFPRVPEGGYEDLSA